MKHACLAIAILAAFQCAAQAQSNVSLYGLVDVSVRRDADYLAGQSRVAQVSGMVNTSRWGVRGTEDLGNGLNANFRLEGGLSPDTGAQAEAASLFDRRATVGLSGKWGRIDIGRDASFGWEHTPVYDPLGGALATPAPVSHSSGRAALLVNGFMFVTNNPYNNTKLRDNNVKYTYTAPNGLLVGLDYSFGEVAGATGRRAGRQVAVGYMKDDINVIAAYDQLRDAADRRQSVALAGGNLRFSPAWKATVGYAVLKADGAFAASSNAVTGAIPNYTTTFGVSADGTIKVAVSAAGVEYAVTPLLSLNAAAYNTHVSGTGIAANDYNTYALLAKYALSKRTFLYGALDREHATTHGGLATVSGQRTNTGVTMGIQTRF